MTHRSFPRGSMAAVWCAAALVAACTTSPAAPSPDPNPIPVPMPAPMPVQDFILSGSWERINSSFVTLDGMVVEVSADGMRALITSTPANPFLFQVGDVKWRTITRVSPTRFSFEDLLRQTGGAQSYVSGFIEAQANGAELAMTFPSTGTIQQWRRR